MLTSSNFLRAAIVSAAMAVGGVALAAEYELVSTVALSRHGVRSPIAGHPALATLAADTWPSWPVPSGHLTPRGAELAKLLGAYYREYYAAQGFQGFAKRPLQEPAGSSLTRTKNRMRQQSFLWIIRSSPA
jgi:hypothetical protein